MWNRVLIVLVYPYPNEGNQHRMNNGAKKKAWDARVMTGDERR